MSSHCRGDHAEAEHGAALVHAAQLAWNRAPKTCRWPQADANPPPLADAWPATGESGAGSCASYHGLYPLLRVLGLAATPDRHAAFYADALGALAGSGEHRRVLISGTADSGMLEHVLRAYRAVGTAPVVTALDLCPTPGLLCQCYAERVGAAIQTAVGDALTWKPDRPYDVVTTHSFIAKFAPAAHRELFARWRALLRTGGRLVTTTRIDPEERNPGFSPERAEAFADTVCQALAPEVERLGIDPAAVRPIARAHCRGIRSHAVRSEQDLRAGLEAAGFAIERLDLVVHRGHVKAGSSGAGTHRTATYADFVARAR
ncbi:MAG: class I SAM-dependent methyltransferase [Proteobacteria bacterium]|nr:class I SAM-dependent methyltransferase [Pseudomonadota bacterium]